MTETRTCPSCGEEIDSELKFCNSCGAEVLVEDSSRHVIDIEPEQVQAKPHQAGTTSAPKSQASADDGLKGRIRQVQEDPTNQEFVEAIKGYATLPGVKAALIAAGYGLLAALLAGLALALLTPESSFFSLTTLDEGSTDDPSILTRLLLYATGLSLAGTELTTAQITDPVSWRSTPILFVLIPILGVGYGVIREFPKTLTQESQKGLFLWGLISGLAFAAGMGLLVLIGADWSSDGEEYAAPLGKTFLYSLIWGALAGVGGVAYLLISRGVSIDLPLRGRAREFLPLVVPPVKIFTVAFIIFSLIGTGIWSLQSVRDAADARGDRSLAASVFDSVIYTGDLGIRNIGLASNSKILVGTGAFDSTTASQEFQSSEEYGNFFEEAGDTNAAFGDIIRAGLLTLQPAPTPIPVYRGGLPADEASYEADRDRLPELIGESEESGFERPEVTIFSYQDVLGAAFIPLVIVFIGILALLAIYAGFLTARRQVTRSTGEAVMLGALVGPVWAILIILLNALTENLNFGELSSESAFISLLIGGAILGGLGGLLTTSQSAKAKQ